MDIKYKRGQILKELRVNKGLKQTDIAEMLGITPQAYQRYEYGETKLSNCRMKIGLKICAILELDPYEAVFGTGQEHCRNC